jgi:antitoxin VapB
MADTREDATALRRVRQAQVAALLDRHGLAAALLRTPANFAWHTGGADNRVNHDDPVGAASVLVTPAAEYIVTTNIEAERMRAEQTPDIGVVEYPWYGEAATAIRALIGDGPLGVDGPPDGAMPGAVNLAREVAPLRYVLDADAIARYRAVGRDALAALEEAAGAVRTGMAERDAAGLVAAACWRRGLYTPVILAAADERAARFRHPLPGAAPIAGRLMLVLCAERGGLVANLTRWVHLVPPDDEWTRRQQACATILRRMREEATQPGRTLAQAFADCQRFYAEAGYPDEWRLHHQGGLSGYGSREVIATPTSATVIQPGHAFAWNPSITGAKAEETFILTETGPAIIAR